MSKQTSKWFEEWATIFEANWNSFKALECKELAWELEESAAYL